MSNKLAGFLGKSFWTGIGAIAAIAALIVAIISIPQAAPIRQGISQTFSGTPAATEPPTATPIPTSTPISTPTPQVILINQTMTCTNCSSGNNLSLRVRNATIDPAKSQVTLLIGVQNISTSTYSSVYISFLKLQDTQTGVSVSGGGDGFSIFPITANQVILFRPTFQFVPVAGHEYSLSAELNSTFEYSSITIKF